MNKTKKEKILESALALFGKNGYNATSTSKIAKEAGVSEGLIFSHFKNKAGLLETILENTEQKVIDDVMKPILAETDPKKVIRRSLEGMFGCSEEEYHSRKLMIKIKWEIDYVHSDKFAPLFEKLSSAFGELGYQNPTMEAVFCMQVVESMLGKIVRGEKKAQEKLKDFLLKKYEL